MRENEDFVLNCQPGIDVEEAIALIIEDISGHSRDPKKTSRISLFLLDPHPLSFEEPSNVESPSTLKKVMASSSPSQAINRSAYAKIHK